MTLIRANMENEIHGSFPALFKRILHVIQVIVW